jgi:hypothetical protein
MDNQADKDRQGSDQKDSKFGQQPTNPAGTSGRTDADLQREGNLGNERNREDRKSDDQEDSGIGNRPGQNQ